MTTSENTLEQRIELIRKLNNMFRDHIEIEDNFYMAGGCFDWSRELSDVDVFFQSEDDFHNVIKELDEFAIRVRVTDNSSSYLWKGIKFDIVKSKFYNSVEEVIESFDFVNCMAGIDCHSSKFISHKDWYTVNKQKRLAIHKITYPMASLRRAFKYAAKGYFVCHGSMLRLAEAIKGQEKPLSAQPIETYPID